MADFEHALFMLLLLVGILSANPPQRAWTIPAIACGLALAFLPPVFSLELPWELIFSLTLPLLFWQNARHWLAARWRAGWRELLLWLLSILALGAILGLSGALPWANSALFGLIATSILWRALEPKENTYQISQLGPLTLVFLLGEVAPAVETPNRYLGGMMSGAAVGVGIALLAIYASKKLPDSWLGWLAIAQAYLAYGLALAIESSGVAAALVSVAVYSEAGIRRKAASLSLPAPLDRWPVFILALALFVFLGWQTHQPLTWALLLEAAAGLLVGWLIAWLGRRMGVAGFIGRSELWQAGLRLGLFLFAALLLWPRNLLVDALPLLAAASLAIMLTVLAVTLLSAVKNLAGPAK
ncbi:MAG: hypothetical protein AB1894_08835 [Chloroflexota bacterium]